MQNGKQAQHIGRMQIDAAYLMLQLQSSAFPCLSCHQALHIALKSQLLRILGVVAEF